jgi:hypothetical protein
VNTVEWVALAGITSCCGVALGWALGVVITRGRAVSVLTELAGTWDAEDHADWCCASGCTRPDGEHFAPGAAMTVLGNLHKVYVPLRTVPCDGECTCGTERYVAAAREAVTRL